jgi:hypothetical protein
MNGVWYHSVGNRYRPLKHFEKYKFYKDLDIVLVQIFEHEWNSNKQYYISLIKDLLINGLKTQEMEEFMQDNRFPIYDVSKYVAIKEIEPRKLNFKKHKFHDAGCTIYHKL